MRPRERALQEAMLHEERLVHLLDRVRVLADRRADRVQSDRAAVELLDDRLENARVHVVEAERVDVEQLQAPVRRLAFVIAPLPFTCA